MKVQASQARDHLSTGIHQRHSIQRAATQGAFWLLAMAGPIVYHVSDTEDRYFHLLHSTCGCILTVVQSTERENICKHERTTLLIGSFAIAPLVSCCLSRDCSDAPRSSDFSRE